MKPKPILNHNEVTWPKPGCILEVQSTGSLQDSATGHLKQIIELREVGLYPNGYMPRSIKFVFCEGNSIVRPFTVDGMATVFVRDA